MFYWKVFTLSFAAALTLAAEPILSSWHKIQSGQYARIYESNEDVIAQNAVTTWIHPTSGTGQMQPTYAGIHEVAYDADMVYVRSTGLGFHVMGPWYRDEGDNNIFGNFPANRSVIFQFPRAVGAPPAQKTLTGLGAIGYFVDGIAMFDSRDAFSYNNSEGADATPGGSFNGDGIWNRDAYVNESVTFDPANAHQAGTNHHYHANPPGLRHLLNDSVDYDTSANTYTENFNGQHSPILGWVSDGYPVYGPYGYSDPLNSLSMVRLMVSGFIKRDGTSGSTNLNTDGRTSLPAWAVDVQGIGPALSSGEFGPGVSVANPIGHYIEDYAYLGDLGFTQGTDFDLDVHNGRFCVTPEFPQGTYAYFVSIETDGTPKFPYNIGRTYYGTPSGGAVNQIPETATIYFEGGPEAPLIANDLEVDNTTGDVTLVWSAVEGGSYQVEQGNLQDDWESMGPEILSDSTEISMTDTARANSDDAYFYRVRLTDLADFDDAGFVYADPSAPALTTIVVTLDNGGSPPPSNLNNFPTTVLFNSSNVAIVSRPSQYEIEIAVDLNGLTTGDYTVSATWDGAPGTWTGSYNYNAPQNNILLIIADDWGIDSSPVDNPDGASLPTMANLQYLSDNGLRFTSAYVQPVCSPTRATILTGRIASRHGVYNPGGVLPSSEITLPEIFTAASSPYELASYGKWHLGSGVTGPADNGGWIDYRGMTGGGVPDYYAWTKVENGVTLPDDVTTYATTEIANDAINFINAQNSAEKPWFLWVAFNAPHTPFHDVVDTNLLQSSWNPGDTDNRSLYEKALEAMDSEIGRILESVDLATTNVIIIGDNGTPGQVVQAPFGSGRAKGSLYEGGTHVPLIIAGPNVGVQGTSDEPVHCVDLFATILDIAGIDTSAIIPVDTEIDSRSFTPAMRGEDMDDKEIVVDGESGRALYKDGYRLVILDDPTDDTDTASYEFYYIPDDPNEQNNLLLGTVSAEGIAVYNALVDHSNTIGGNYDAGSYLVNNVETVYIELPNPGAPNVPQLTNNNGNVEPIEILIGGQPATFIGRVDSSEVEDRYWVKVGFDSSAAGLTAGTYSMTVQFRDRPSNGETRLYTALNTFTVDG
ncbi:MAG: sulfatase-like hydrolase/transferase [Verrucomicrobiota bacterium]